MSDDPAADIARAERDAAAARQRLTSTVSALQTKLSPKRVAKQMAHDAADAAQTSVDTAKRYPAVVAGALTLAGLLAVRRPLSRLFRRKKKPATVPAQARSHHEHPKETDA